MPTPTWIESFAHQVTNKTYYGTNAGPYDSVQTSGSPFSYAQGRRVGSWALSITQDGSNQLRMSKTVAAGNRTLVESFYFKCASAPAADSRFWTAIANSNGSLTFEASTGKLM